MNITRRNFSKESLLLASALVGGVTLMAGCTTSTVNGVTTVTLNVAQVNAWGQALVNSTTLVAGLPGINATPEAQAIKLVGPMISGDLAAFNKAANGALSLTFNTTSPAAGITSLVTDAQTLLNDTSAAIGSNLGGVAQEYLDAIKTVVSLIQAATATSLVAGATPMTEAQALATLGVK
jgi:hypothetical protein